MTISDAHNVNMASTASTTAATRARVEWIEPGGNAPMRSRECRRTVLRASADSGQRRDFTTSGHVSIQLKSRPEIKVYPYNVGEEIRCLPIQGRRQSYEMEGRTTWLLHCLKQPCLDYVFFKN
jgi:hypothetical protein